ncbi:hypothetical protein [Ancylobacter oerskovii]|uniref:DUF2213 domain-containing protein n=1 Tax=Ancylobacter oerskovii TaxID=459519 RepID=A0ABW4Z1F9_9HYPH|nr:hypothetical protein [Ancylobacter oerskovii]MBS7545073.1 hypothetical protein [Ancylobacter oerskovii]
MSTPDTAPAVDAVKADPVAWRMTCVNPRLAVQPSPWVLLSKQPPDPGFGYRVEPLYSAPLDDLTGQIAAQISKALTKLGATHWLLSIVGSWKDTLPDEDILQMLTEWNAQAPALAAQEPGAVKVRELVWVERENVHPQYISHTVVGDYCIARTKGGEWEWWLTTCRGKCVVRTLDAAKAATQSDHTRRILSEIEVAPPVAREEGRSAELIGAVDGLASSVGMRFVPDPAKVAKYDATPAPSQQPALNLHDAYEREKAERAQQPAGEAGGMVDISAIARKHLDLSDATFDQYPHFQEMIEQAIKEARAADAARIAELQAENVGLQQVAEVWKTAAKHHKVALTACKGEVERLTGLVDVALDALDNYADPTGYSDNTGEPYGPEDVNYPGTFAKETAANIRAALGRG